MGLVRTLFEGEQEHAQTALPEGLRDLYGGDLHFPASPAQRPYIIGNFVCTRRDALAKAGASRFGSVAIHALDTVGNSIDPRTTIQFLRSQFGVQILLHEGGPTLFGQFLAAQAVDELFLTLSPQIAGRAARTNRPGIVQGVQFAPNSAPWYQLLSLRQSADHLYLRYRFKRGGTTE